MQINKFVYNINDEIENAVSDLLNSKFEYFNSGSSNNIQHTPQVNVKCNVNKPAGHYTILSSTQIVPDRYECSLETEISTDRELNKISHSIYICDIMNALAYTSGINQYLSNHYVYDIEYLGNSKAVDNENNYDISVINYNLKVAISASTWVQSQAAIPTYTRRSGDDGESFTLESTTTGASIYFTTGSEYPTITSSLYTGRTYLTQSCTIKAISVAENYLNSETGSWNFVARVAKPTITASSDSAPSTIEINCDTAGATIRYEIGEGVTESSPIYSSSFVQNAAGVIRSRAYRADLTASLLAEKSISA